ncbi:kinase-like domain-containing protein [Trichoderma sp. SZMC 28013]
MSRETTVSASSSQSSQQPVHSIFFSAANTSAIHLLQSLSYTTAAPSNLKCDKRRIGYQLEIPSLLPSSYDASEPLWEIGAGPAMGSEASSREPEILLCPPGDTLGIETARRFIAPIQASLYFVKSGALILKSRCNERPIIYEQGGIHDKDIELRPDGRQTCVLRRAQNFLRFGDYRFLLEFVTAEGDQDDSQVQPQQPRHDDHGLDPLQILGCAPMVYCKTSHNVWLHPIPHTSRTSGVNIYTGEPVSVTTLPLDQLSKTERKHLLIASTYHDKPHKGVLGVFSVWCDHGHLTTDFLLGVKDPVCCSHVHYSTPLAKHNFRSMEWKKIEYQQWISYFYQTLLGLAELHRRRVPHGRIIPESLLLLEDTPDVIPARNQPPLMRAFLSLPIEPVGIREASVCVAPEIWKANDPTWLDDFKSDIWALGTSWLFAFARPPENIKMNNELRGKLEFTLRERTMRGIIKEPFTSLLHKMLAWKPRDRPNVDEILEHETWQSFQEDRKRKRIERIQAASLEPQNAKKVRVLSPD